MLLTAHDSLDLMDEVREAGVAAYIVKPAEPRALQWCITLALARFEDW